MFLNQALTTSLTLLRGVLPEPFRELLPCPRDMHVCPGGVRIDLRGIGLPGSEDAASHLEERLEALPCVERAEVNGRISAVFVACDPDRVDHDKLLTLVTELDEQEEHAHESPVQLVEEHLRATVRLTAGIAGIGLIFLGRAIRAPQLPVAVPALLQLVNATPAIREQLDRRLGHGPTDALFNTANLVTQTLTLRPTALFVQAVANVGRYVETRAEAGTRGRGWRSGSPRVRAPTTTSGPRPGSGRPTCRTGRSSATPTWSPRSAPPRTR